jgi:hypothetical protein
MIQASDRESTIAPSKPSLRQLSRSVSFPAFGSLASTKTHSPKPATSSTPAQRQSITFTIQLTSYIPTDTTACATILNTTHPNHRHAPRPDRVCTPSCHAPHHAKDSTVTPRHITPDRSNLTVDERSHVFRSQTDASLAVVCLLACGTANASGDCQHCHCHLTPSRGMLPLVWSMTTSTCVSGLESDRYLHACRSLRYHAPVVDSAAAQLA